MTVVKTDINGTPVEATYTPTVEAVQPSAENVTSSGKQGQVQTGTPIFKAGDAQAPILIDADHPARLLDPYTGQASQALSVDALNQDGKVIGSYTIDPMTGQVSFQPQADFIGQAQAAQVQVEDANGSLVLGSYTPTVEANQAVEEVQEQETATFTRLIRQRPMPANHSYSAPAQVLPQTGSKESNYLAAASLLATAGLALLTYKSKRRED